MYEPVDAPLPVPSPRSLLSVAQLTGRIVEGSLSTTGGDVVDDQAPGAPSGSTAARWATDGVTFTHDACGAIEDDLTFCEGDSDFADPNGTPSASGTVVTEDAIRMRAGSICSRSSGPDTLAVVEARARRMLGLWQHEAVARSFWNDQLRVDAGIVTAAAGVAVIDGLATIEEAMAGLSADPDADIECGAGQRAMIHVNPRTVTVLASMGLIREAGGLLLTAMDSVVVTGPGYTGDGPAGQSAADADSAWVYGTGFVDVRLSAPQVTRTLDRQDNDYTVWAARAAVVTAPGCCVVTSKLNLTSRG